MLYTQKVFFNVSKLAEYVPSKTVKASMNPDFARKKKKVRHCLFVNTVVL